MGEHGLVAGILAAQAEHQALRRQIHARPELGFEEQLTSDLVAERLQHWGVEVHRGMARTGVIGLVHGQRAGSAEQRARAIGLRADMDALPIQEHSRFAHASTHPGVMHACGHDGHTAMLLAAARHLAATRNFCGTAVLIFQPAEEGRGGAQAMVAEGLFEKFPMQAVYGMHNWPGLPAGHFALSPGPVMASANTFRIVLKGQGSHAALPHLGLDPVPVAAQLVMALQTILSRNARPIDAGVVSVTMLHAGEATNVVPDHCVVEGTVRTFRNEVLDLIERRMGEIARHTCAAHGLGCEFEFVRRAPAVVNHPGPTAFAREVLVRMLGPEKVLEQEPSMPSEDFAFMLQAKAGCYAFIGNGEGSHRSSGHGEGPCLLHNPSYDFNDDLLGPGASYWVRLVEAALG